MTQIKLRRDTAANWTSVNPVLGSGEPGFEADTNRMKVGDGSTSWNNLDYLMNESMDGQWVTLNQKIANNVTWDSTTPEATYDLSSYLPDDGFNYEVWLTASIETGTTADQFITAQIRSDISNNMYITGCRTNMNARVSSNGSIAIPVGTGRTITQYASTSVNANGTYNIWLKGYRRMGTNS